MPALNFTTNTTVTNDTNAQLFRKKPIFSSVAFSLGIFGNVLSLVVLVKSADRHRWKVFYKMIFVLAIIDLVGILTTSPIAIVVYNNGLQWIGGQPLCDFFSVMLIFCGLCTCLIIVIMSVDRYMAIVHPFKYMAIQKEKLTKFVIVGIILFSLFVALLPVFGLGHNMVHYPGSWCFPDFYEVSIKYALFSYFYSCLNLLLVFMTALLNIWAIVKLIIKRNSEVRRGSNTNRSRTNRHVDVYIMILLVVIFVVFAVCWSPFMVRIIINQVFGYPVNEMADLVTLRMASTNQVLDPWVYLLFRRESIRKFVQYIVRKKSHKEDTMHIKAISISRQLASLCKDDENKKKTSDI